MLTHKHHEACCCEHKHTDNHGHHDHHNNTPSEECCCNHESDPHHIHDHSCHCHHEHDSSHQCTSHIHGESAGEKRIYILENLGCANCASKMESKIHELPGVSYASITFATRQLRITAEHPDVLLPEIQNICTSIESQVKVIPRDNLSNTHHSNQMESDMSPTAISNKKNSKERKELCQIILGGIFFITGLILQYNDVNEIISIAVFILGYLILGSKILLEAGRNILKGKIFDENFLMSIATLGAFAIREYPEAMGVMLFYRVGEFFEHKAVERSRSQIMDAIDMRPEVVNLVLDDDITIIPAEKAKIDDILLIRPGDRIPLDGIVVDGSSRIDTSPITGEPVPHSVKSGDKVISGCINTSGQLKIRVEKTLSESMVTRILDSVENAAASKPKMDRFITKFARIYTPFVVITAFAVAVIPSILIGNWNYWIYTALTLLVMSCPCALVLSIPLAFFSGIGAGSRKGILFKGGSAIEGICDIKAVVMDKTGTITHGNFKVQKIFSQGNFKEDELLRICASCEQNSTHPIAHSIVAAAADKNITVSVPLSMKEIAGHGVIGELTEGSILCGNRKLMEKYNINISDNISDNISETYGAEIFLAINGNFEGYFLVSDTIKDDAPKAIKYLKDMGLHTAMLTGDSENSAAAVAKETGIDEVYAKLLPQDKVDILMKIRHKYGNVMFAGDGINDAPVLAGANIGAAMGNGADAAIEASDIVFMTSSVDALPEAISIARRTKKIAVQNVIFALIIKILVMMLGLCGFANMWLAVFADTGVAMLCILNSIRILFEKDKE